jgi:putative nucleotidyltransferase with HDIG domain
MYGVVRVLMRALEGRYRYAREHAHQVARLASEVADEMGCAKELAEGIRVAGRLHDVGAVSISDMILLKPGPLTELETEIIRTHPLVGAQILDALEFPWSVKPGVRYHHERLDGSGYPEGLMGEEIPLPARILAVADVTAAMIADRPHRPARTEAEALAELRANAGAKYDSAAVEALARVLERGPT